MSSTSTPPSMVPEKAASSTLFQTFSGNPLNKLHFHRKDDSFIDGRLTHPNARFVAYHSFKPFVVKRDLDRPMVGVIDEGIDSRQCIAWFTHDDLTAAGIDIRNNQSTAVLLGQLDPENPNNEINHIHESTNPSILFASGVLPVDTPIWAVSVDDTQKVALIDRSLSQYHAQAEPKELRLVLDRLNFVEASVLGQGRALLEWHGSAQFCGRCGSPTVSIEGGAKRKCNNSTEHAKAFPRGCGRTLYPRNDAVTITLTVSHDGERVLLGRKPEMPKCLYTCIAGFLEGGESIEEGARREVYEETGVKAGAVKYFGTQPWPFLGGQHMLACFAQVVDPADERVELLDGELESARWFTHDEIGNMIKQADQTLDAWSAPHRITDPKQLRIPPPFAIAYQLILHWYKYREVDSNQQQRIQGIARQRKDVNLENARFIAHL